VARGYEKIADLLREIFSFPKFFLPVFKKEWLTVCAVILLMAINLFFSVYNLGKFAAVDEPLWTSTDGRILKFWNNVSDGELWKTMVSDKPGITVAIISGAGLQFENPKDYEKNPIVEDKNETSNLNFALRFPLIMFNLILLPVLYFLLRRLFDKRLALMVLAMIALSPILIGISRIVNPDGLLWILTTISLLSFLVYLRDKSYQFLYWAGIFLGLSILTKYVANLLYIFFLLLIFVEYVINREKYEKIGIYSYFKKHILDYLFLVLFSLFTFYLFLPAAWVDITRIFESTIFSKAFLSVWPVFVGIIIFVMADLFVFKFKIFRNILNFLVKIKNKIFFIIILFFLLMIIATLANTYLGMKFFDLEAIIASPKTSSAFNGYFGMMLANFYSLIFGVIPLSLIAIIYISCVNLINLIKKPHNKDYQDSYFYLVLFILIYYFASTFSDVSATVRYQVIIFPLALILAGIGISHFLQIKNVKKYLPWVVPFIFLVVFCVLSLIAIKPFYFSYASDLLPKQYVLNLKDMGDGSYEAAQYLNNLPNAKNLNVWTDKRGVCVFFIGNCSSGIGSEKSFDYFVVSAGRESRTSRMTLSRYYGGNKSIVRLDKLYDFQKADFYLKIGGRPNNFVKVIKADKFWQSESEN